MERITTMVDDETPTNEVRLFQAPLASSAQRLGDLSNLVSPDEHAREVRYRNATRRQAFVVGRAAIRTTLGAYLGIPPSEIRLSLDSNGKPKLENVGGQRQPSFNISHSPTLVVIGVTELDGIGVDVEDLDRRIQVDSLVRGYFSPTERAAWASYPEELRRTAFLRGWTRKEAAWKFFGSEALMHWENIDVPLDANPHTRVIATTAPGGALIRLHCFSWCPTPNSIASVVVRPTAGESPRFEIQPIDFTASEQLTLRGSLQ